MVIPSRQPIAMPLPGHSHRGKVTEVMITMMLGAPHMNHCPAGFWSRHTRCEAMMDADKRDRPQEDGNLANAKFLISCWPCFCSLLRKGQSRVISSEDTGSINWTTCNQGPYSDGVARRIILMVCGYRWTLPSQAHIMMTSDHGSVGTLSASM